MNKRKKCPYCGRRISYPAVFASRRKAEYKCETCGKESRVIVDLRVLLVFLGFARLSVVIMFLWICFGLASNPLGILMVSLPLIAFALLSPGFVRFEPLRKYKKSMEAKRAGIEYSDNLMISELDDEFSGGSLENSGKFRINSELFNQIKADRTAAKENMQSGDLVSDSAKLRRLEQQYLHVSEDVRENHSAATDTPLKKLHSEGSRINRSRHYVAQEPEIITEDAEEDVKEYKRSEAKRYSGNRKF